MLLSIRRGCAAFAVIVLWTACAQPLAAQFTLPGLGGDEFGGAASPPKVEVDAVFTTAAADQPARLFLTAKIAPGYHIYSITQKSGGPAATKIVLNPSTDYRVTSAFQATAKAEIHFANEIWPNLPLEEHTDSITWYAPLEFAPGVDPARVVISGALDLQVCDPSTCIPLKLPFEAKRVAAPPIEVETPPAGATGEYRPEGASVALRGFVSPRVAAPGDMVHIVLTATPDKDWHVYALEPRDPQIIGKGKPTVIALEQIGALKVESISTTAPIIEKASELEGIGVEKYHEGAATWTIDLRVPADAPPGPVTLSGLIGYQACFAGGCKPPMGAKFQAEVTIGAAAASEEAPLAFERAAYAQAAKASEAQPLPIAANEPEATSEASSLPRMLLFGFLGGIVLNLMPCVLPVIGLKVMSFVEQAGQSRHEALALNVWYSCGIVTVFLVLASVAIVFGLTWGEQFGHDGFNIALAAIVFAMALSLLGVWEIPIPGFVGSSKAHEIASQEGPFGAFCKGIVTTVLATPCTGPFMGTALAWAVLQPPAYTLGVFASIGLGMASPYLLIGAFPALIRFLPKPGAWMDTFKQIMGFVLLGTVIFLLTFIAYPLVVPTILLLTGIAAGCWWINRTPPYEPLAIRLRAWAGGTAFAALIGYIAFAHTLGTVPVFGTIDGLRGIMESRLNRYLAQHGGATLEHEEGELPWQPFTPDRLAALHRENKTILVDFTADWCLICKTLEKTVLNTDAVREAVRRNGVQTLVADYTKRPENIKTLLRELQSNGVPVIAIYPAGNPHQPIVFRGAYTQADILDALQQAGPSKSAALETAMRE